MRTIAFITLLMAAVPLWGQRVEARFEAGVTSFADEGVDHHLALGASLRAYLSHRWSVDPEFLYLRRDHSFARHRDYVFWGNFAFDLRSRERAVVPYWFGGPGVINNRTSFGPGTFSNTEAGFATGLGVRFLSQRWFVAPQVRLGLADSVFAEFTASVGYVLRR
jgi:hypothetical protein